MAHALLTLRGLTADFDDGRRIARVLHGIDLTLSRGEALGIVGESGCGKSVTWLALLGLLGPRARVGGSARLDDEELVGASSDRLTRVRGRRVAMISQDPSSALNPVQRIGWQLGEALMLHRGLTGEAARVEAVRLLDRVGIAGGARRLSEYPHELSGGTNQRVMIAMALAGQPDILVADEPTTALDATIQAQILELIADLRRENGMAVVLISHDLGVVSEVAERVAVMYCGRVVEVAPVADIFARPAHPYTAGLLAALPALDGPRRPMTAIPGTVPQPGALPSGCAFSPRCPVAEPGCDAGPPPLAALGGARHAACVKPAHATAMGSLA